MSKESVELLLSVGFTGHIDNDEIAALTNQLIKDINELDLASAQLLQGNKASSGMMGDPITLGTIVIALINAGAFTTLIGAIHSWMSRDERRKLSLQVGNNKIELSGVSEKEQAKLIEWFKTQTGLSFTH